MSISLHIATQAIHLRRSGTSLYTLRVTLWITTAIHLDTPNIMPEHPKILSRRIANITTDSQYYGLPHDPTGHDMMQDTWSIQAGGMKNDNEFRIRP
ncbi:MAG: hypothetical protein O7B35_01080 [Deltaproteobacteria bacterium]|nr:hypothetical protein [Deltaproteobacteria bacterium]